jgi:hypothetical protein
MNPDQEKFDLIKKVLRMQYETYESFKNNMYPEEEKKIYVDEKYREFKMDYAKYFNSLDMNNKTKFLDWVERTEQ